MNMTLKSVTGACALAFSMLGFVPEESQAAACTVLLDATNPDGSLADATDCGVASVANHNPTNTGAAINAGNPGGLGLTWSFIDRDPGTEPGEIDAAFAFTGTTDGNFMINADLVSFTNFVVTMKDGDPLSNEFLWFLIDTSPLANVCSATQLAAGWDLCGTWSMYGEPNAQGVPIARVVSHMDLFGANGALPEPGSLLLLSTVLGGIGLTTRRRKQLA